LFLATQHSTADRAVQCPFRSLPSPTRPTDGEPGSRHITSRHVGLSHIGSH